MLQSFRLTASWIWFSAFPFLIIVAHAQPPDIPEPFTTNSVAVHHMMIKFLSEGDSAPPAVDDAMIYTFYVVTNVEQDLLVPSNPSFACDAKLFNAKGKEVPRTPLGKQYGAEFENAPSILDFKDKQLKSMRLLPKMVDYINGAGHRLPAPSKLFEIKEPGRYTLKLRFQVYRKIKIGQDRVYKRLCFPEVIYDVVKHPEKRQPSPSP